MEAGILVKKGSAEALTLGRELVTWLRNKKIGIRSVPESAKVLGVRSVKASSLGASLDLLIVLGGDGTLLRGAGLLGEHQVPVMGINLGGLGFLTEITGSEMYETLEAFFQGKAKIRKRIVLTAALDSTRRVFRAINEFAITVGNVPRLMKLDAHVDGVFVNSFRADGLLISTPTGSTAYCLSAGGPIVHPLVDCIILTPVAPHTLTSRPLVVPRKSRITVNLTGEETEGRIIADGHLAQPLKPGESVKISAADKPLLIVRSASKTYYEILRTKLHWGER